MVGIFGYFVVLDIFNLHRIDALGALAHLVGGDADLPHIVARLIEMALQFPHPVVEADDMPNERDPLSADEKKLLRKWIDDGAVWATDEIDPLAHTFDRRAAQNWIRRLTVSEYIETVRSLTSVDIAKEAREILPPDIRADGVRMHVYVYDPHDVLRVVSAEVLENVDPMFYGEGVQSVGSGLNASYAAGVARTPYALTADSQAR